MASPRPSLSLAGTLLMLPLLLSACGGTTFGDALSRSFSRAPAAPASPPAGAPRALTPANPAPTTASQPRPTANEPPARPVDPATPVSPVAPAVRPAPYRVTIRLPLADPSAPAEVVTKALRAAGVPFEVETIERMPAAGTAATESPAPATGSAAPASRPAPAPR
ncbi:hypothetical protein [Synechococcus sp. CS-1332]|uniref:hypothetical protein n=1 Tax=Synechococcus sp. CS-1332 TaxID=2847972 RepID=UPI00223AA482|nr:hypothetical protein [Synechococcus sp. CS-1332]MCT0207179.1 hypothetical protein [Synechococcus sp. CS-1332]